MTEKKLKSLEDRRKEKQKEEDWSDEDWENWAFQIYREYPETKKYLPEWFIEEVEKRFNRKKPEKRKIEVNHNHR